MYRAIAPVSVVWCLFAAAPAAAQAGSNFLSICNDARDGPAVAAAAFATGGGWIAEGWIEIPEGACDGFALGAENGPLYEGVAYYFAFTRTFMWDGRYDVCVTPVPDRDFRIFASDWSACNGGFEHRGFDEIYVTDGYAEVTLTPGG